MFFMRLRFVYHCFSLDTISDESNCDCDFYGVRFCTCCLQCLTSAMIFAISEYENFVPTFGDWWLSWIVYLNGTICRLGHSC